METRNNPNAKKGRALMKREESSVRSAADVTLPCPVLDEVSLHV